MRIDWDKQEERSQDLEDAFYETAEYDLDDNAVDVPDFFWRALEEQVIFPPAIKDRIIELHVEFERGVKGEEEGYIETADQYEMSGFLKGAIEYQLALDDEEANSWAGEFELA